MEWREILGGAYAVSEAGDIKRLLVGMRGAVKGHIVRPCLHRKPPRGRYRVKLQIMGERQGFYVHTLVAEAFLGPRPKGAEIDHINGDHLNNHYTNLAYKTPRQNWDAAIALHLHCHGEAHSHAKLTEITAKEALKRHLAGEPQKAIAADLGVQRATLWALFTRRTWKHLDTSNL